MIVGNICRYYQKVKDGLVRAGGRVKRERNTGGGRDLLLECLRNGRSVSARLCSPHTPSSSRSYSKAETQESTFIESEFLVEGARGPLRREESSGAFPFLWSLR